MSQSKHTPGPWSYRQTGTWPDTNHHLGIYAEHASMPQVAKVEGMGYVSDANARLIAAAPDMLEALKKADQFIRNGIELGYIRMPDADTPDSAHDTPPMIRAALAKAEPTP